VARLYFISDRKLTPSEPPERVILEAVAAGVDMVQIREKDLPDRDLLRISRSVVEGSAGTGTEIFLNSRFDIALSAGADGVHLPASGLSVSRVRRAVGDRLRIGVSTHSVREVVEAGREGADFVTFGPVFETPSKAPYGPPQGLERLREAVERAAVPVLAIGGIKPESSGEIFRIPVGGIAVISAIACAGDRRAAVEAFRAAERRAAGEHDSEENHQ
jgi:thiamine-phosphate pyrophosphorylase